MFLWSFIAGDNSLISPATSNGPIAEGVTAVSIMKFLFYP
jgi:hypothetical protein